MIVKTNRFNKPVRDCSKAWRIASNHRKLSLASEQSAADDDCNRRRLKVHSFVHRQTRKLSISSKEASMKLFLFRFFLSK